MTRLSGTAEGTLGAGGTDFRALLRDAFFGADLGGTVGVIGQRPLSCAAKIASGNAARDATRHAPARWSPNLREADLRAGDAPLREKIWQSVGWMLRAVRNRT
ncbi:MAG: hypothetical protein PHX82_03950 [Paracoccaceae bacterium]|nr:hypothetical protein [Paracoccaceae bacterium]